MNHSMDRLAQVVVSVWVALLMSTCTNVEAFPMVHQVGGQSSHQRQASSSLYMSSISAPSNNNERPSLRRDVSTDTDSTVATTMTTASTTQNNIETNVYMKNLVQNRWMELPASSSLLKNRQQEQLDVLEQMIGRIAMMGAIGILIRECYDGQSILEQVMSIV